MVWYKWIIYFTTLIMRSKLDVRLLQSCETMFTFSSRTSGLFECIGPKPLCQICVIHLWRFEKCNTLTFRYWCFSVMHLEAQYCPWMVQKSGEFKKLFCLSQLKMRLIDPLQGEMWGPDYSGVVFIFYLATLKQAGMLLKQMLNYG